MGRAGYSLKEEEVAGGLRSGRDMHPEEEEHWRSSTEDGNEGIYEIRCEETSAPEVIRVGLL